MSLEDEAREAAEIAARLTAGNATAEPIVTDEPILITGKTGPALFSELQAAGLSDLGVFINTEFVQVPHDTSSEDLGKLKIVLKAHDPSKPAPVPPVEIESVSSAQARTALFNRGLLDEVETIVQNHPYRPVQIFYQSANVWEKSNPYVRAIALELNLLTIGDDGAEVDSGFDALFEAANKL